MVSNRPGKVPRIAVVGSINMDLVARTSRLPLAGETVSGDSFQTVPGGKGANQAVAAARLGAWVSMVGRLGDDAFGSTMRQNLAEEGIDLSFVLPTTNCSSGVALIAVATTGANQIIVVPGANGRLCVADLQECRSLIATADALVVQLETPQATVKEALRIARDHGVLTILDPAPVPATPLPPALLSVDILSPNQTEAQSLTGIAINDWASAEAASQDLQRQGARDVVLKMGGLGAFVLTATGQSHRITAPAVKVVDTTAAGDAFTAALTVALCEGQSLPAATHFACVAGSLACTRFGAQPAMPRREEIEEFVAKHL